MVESRKAAYETLADMLAEKSFECLWAQDGLEALHKVAEFSPDVLLVNPEVQKLDGCQLVGALKGNPSTASIPVVFITSLRDHSTRKRAYECGVVDLIFKPVESIELLTRIERQATLYRLQEQQKHLQNVLEEKVARRTMELRAANRRLAELNQRLSAIDRSKSEFLNTISHELRTPANGFFGAMELLLDEAGPDVDPTIIEILNQSRDRLMDLMEDATLLVQIRLDKDPVAVSQAEFGRLLKQLTQQTPLRNQVDFVVQEGELAVPVCRELFDIFWIKLLQVADCFVGDRSMRVTANVYRDKVEIHLLAPGAVLPANLVERFFEDFAIDETKVPHGRVGLRPTIVHEAVLGMGGRIHLEQNEDGLSFRIELPGGEPALPSK